MPLPHSLLQTLLLHGACPFGGKRRVLPAGRPFGEGAAPAFQRGLPPPQPGAHCSFLQKNSAPRRLICQAGPCHVHPAALLKEGPAPSPRLPHPDPVKKALGRPFFVHFPSFWASQPCNSSEFYLFSLAAGRGILLPAKGGLAGDRPAAKAGCVSRWSPKAGSSFYSAGRRVPWVSAARAAVLV